MNRYTYSPIARVWPAPEQKWVNASMTYILKRRRDSFDEDGYWEVWDLKGAEWYISQERLLREFKYEPL